MNKQKIFYCIIIIASLILFVSCTEENNPDDNINNSIAISDIENSENDNELSQDIEYPWDSYMVDDNMVYELNDGAKITLFGDKNIDGYNGENIYFIILNKTSGTIELVGGSQIEAPKGTRIEIEDNEFIIILPNGNIIQQDGQMDIGTSTDTPTIYPIAVYNADGTVIFIDSDNTVRDSEGNIIE